jgi:hypothetical protein
MHTVRALVTCAMLGGGAFALTPIRESAAQTRVRWRVVGDTSSGRHDCGAALAIDAISQWFESFSAADSVGLAKATAVRGPRGFVFSTGRFTPSEEFFVTHRLSQLVAYARTRARRHERMTIQEVKFNGWRYGALQFGPIYFLRTADDLGRKPLPGFGKGGYRCHQGLSVLNVGPRPAFDPGPRQ